MPKENFQEGHSTAIEEIVQRGIQHRNRGETSKTGYNTAMEEGEQSAIYHNIGG
jgi:hypothetical protein